MTCWPSQSFEPLSHASPKKYQSIQNCAFGAHHVRHVRHCRAGSTAKVKHFGTRLHRAGTDATNDASTQLRAERVPHAVLDPQQLDGFVSQFQLTSLSQITIAKALVFSVSTLSNQSLLTINRLTRNQVPRHKWIILATPVQIKRKARPCKHKHARSRLPDVVIWYDMIWYDMIWYDMIPVVPHKAVAEVSIRGKL